MSIRDEQTTNITNPEEQTPKMTTPSSLEDEVRVEMGFPSLSEGMPRRSTDPVNGYEEPGGSMPRWEEYQWGCDRPGVTVRSAVFGGLSGGIFFFGLVAAILSGHFWPVFLVALALTSLVGSLGSSKAQAIYGGVQGSVFFLGLAFCAATGWWWPGILLLLGIEAILSIGNGLLELWPVARPSIIVDQYYTALRNHDYARAYRFLDANLTASLSQQQFTAMARQNDAAEGTVSRYSIAPDLDVTATPLPGEPLPLVDLAGNPAENVIVKVIRAKGTVYAVHLQVRRVGKEWRITTFDSI